MPQEITPTESTEISADSLFAGRLVCLQHKRGYRFSVDAILLAHFITPRPGEKILDLGAGCGVISLILKYRQPQAVITALELQPKLAALIRRNIEANGFHEGFSVIEGDCRRIREYVAAGNFDRVLCNPPYRKRNSGRVNPGREEVQARHEMSLDARAVLRACSSALKTRGRVALVYPAARLAGLLAGMKEAGLEPKRLQIVHSYPGSAGRLVLVEGVKGGGEELAILPPFHIYSVQNGAYTREMAALYGSVAEQDRDLRPDGH